MKIKENYSAVQHLSFLLTLLTKEFITLFNVLSPLLISYDTRLVTVINKEQ